MNALPKLRERILAIMIQRNDGSELAEEFIQHFLNNMPVTQTMVYKKDVIASREGNRFMRIKQSNDYIIIALQLLGNAYMYQYTVHCDLMQKPYWIVHANKRRGTSSVAKMIFDARPILEEPSKCI
jgi:hypothetical protein